MSAFLGFEWHAWLIAGAFLVMIIGTIAGYYTRGGTDIDEHPVDDRGRSPGASEPSSIAGAGRTPESPTGQQADGGRFSGHGTR
jgi:hypothetical protein